MEITKEEAKIIVKGMEDMIHPMESLIYNDSEITQYNELHDKLVSYIS